MDLIVLDGAFPECALGFVHYFKVPFIYINTVGFHTFSLSLAGNPTPYSITPFLAISVTDDMNLPERLKNTLWYMFGGALHSFMVSFLYYNVLEDVEILFMAFPVVFFGIQL